MINIRPLNTRSSKEINEVIINQFGNGIKGTLYRGSNNKIYLGSEHMQGIDLESINAEGVGLYLGQMDDDGFRPSIEGAQLIKPVKNTYELTKEQLIDTLMGFSINLETTNQGYCILTYEGEVISAGKIINGKVWTYVPKERRIKNLKTINEIT